MSRFFLLILAVVGLGAVYYQYQRWRRSMGAARAKQLLHWTGIVVGLFLFSVLFLRSGSVLAIPLLGALVPAFGRWRALWRNFRVSSAPLQARTRDARESTFTQVETPFLRMIMNPEAGKYGGTVLQGRFKGAELAQLNLEDLLDLYRECQVDSHSVTVLEAYLDKVHTGVWRERHARDRRKQSRSSAGLPMDKQEAYEILGLQPGASLQEIKTAYRRLMQRMHPDQGGSDYLAARINKARDLLGG